MNTRDQGFGGQCYALVFLNQPTHKKIRGRKSEYINDPKKGCKSRNTNHSQNQDQNFFSSGDMINRFPNHHHFIESIKPSCNRTTAAWQSWCTKPYSSSHPLRITYPHTPSHASSLPVIIPLTSPPTPNSRETPKRPNKKLLVGLYD